MKSLKQYITEAAKTYKVDAKDWKRMADLRGTGSEGKGVADKIKDKYKAAARFVAGCKLCNVNPKDRFNVNHFICPFDDFGNKALELGATLDEIIKLFDETEIPANFKEEYHPKASGISGVINQLKNDGFKITSKYVKASYEGQERMSRNGLAYSVAKEYTLEKDGKKCVIFFDDITNEALNSPSYGYVTPTRMSRFYKAFKDAKKAFLNEVNKVFGTSY